MMKMGNRLTRTATGWRSVPLWGWLVLAVVLWSPAAALADGEPLSATLTVHGAGRSGGPRSATVTLLWNGSALLEGDLHVEIMDGHSVRSRSVVEDLALIRVVHPLQQINKS